MKKLLSLLIIVLSVLVFGCKKTTELTKSVDPTSLGSTQFSLTSSAWEQLPSVPGIGRIGAFGLSIENKGYIGSGASSGSPGFVEYDPTTNKWTKKQDFPGGNWYDAETFTIGSKGYVCLGFPGPGKNLWEYDPAMDKWSRKADLPLSPTPFYSNTITGFTIGNKGYVGVFCGSLHLYEYNPEQNVWIKKASLPTGNRSGAVAFSIGNKGYVGLGVKKSNKDGSDTFMNDLWEYNPDTNTWIRKADFPGGGRWYSAAFTIKDKGYVGTGLSSFNYETGFKNDMWQYDSVSDTWTQLNLAGLPERSRAVGFSIGNSGYIGTGFMGNHSRSDFWKFSVQ